MENYTAEFNTEERSGDAVSIALYDRISNVESRLNCNIEIIEEPGDWDRRNSFVSLAAKSINAGDGEYDLISQYSMSASIGTMQDLYQDISQLRYVDLEKPWWPDDLAKSTSINGKIYFVSGDIAPTLIYNLFVIYFNQNMLNKLGYESPYGLVDEGKWTYDKLKEMTAGLYEDLNNDNVANGDDQYGMILNYTVLVDAFQYAGGINIIDVGNDGVYQLSPSFGSEKAATYLADLCEYIHGSNDVFINSNNNNSFLNGNTLFLAGTIDNGVKNVSAVDFDYGIVPMPKYDEQQDGYNSLVGFAYSMYTVPVDVKNAEQSGALLEALASDAYRNITPEIFEVALKYRYSLNKEDSRMYDIVRDGIVFDVGRNYADALGSAFGLFRNAVVNNNPNWASIYASNKDSIENKLQDIINKIG